MKRPRTLTVLALLMLLTALGTALFWIVFFSDLEAQRGGYFASRCAAWFAWELSFPLADTWMAATALLAALGLWQQRPTGLLFGLVSGSAMVFLGLMDMLFFLQNGLYLPLNGEVAVETFIHLWMSAFGLAAIWLIWSRRHELGC